MKKIMLVTAVAALLSAPAAFAAQGVQWGYTGKESPENWATLSPEFAACAGKNQSPINLTEFIEAELAPLSFEYKPGGFEVINNGHTIQVNYEAGSVFKVDGKDFVLKQFHFHAPSENLINGQSFPFEAHLVHVNDAGEIAVVTVMYKEGEANKTLASFWPQMPVMAGGSEKLSNTVNALDLMPENQDYFRFNGSLTTPPCTEGVRWFVFKEPVSIAKEQVEAFSKIMGGDNNRPVQPVNARPVLQ
ncbi:MAG: carbonic anhydrase family protein [bacterium]|nr:carbonic anhydrase family protein [bacterium]